VDPLDAVFEIFTWIGFGGAVLFGLIALAVWVGDGTWLPAEALVDHDETGTYVRWFDADGDANNALASEADAAALAGVDRARIWYRYGWRDRMRLTARPPGLRAVLWAAGALLALGILALVASWVLLFVPR